MKNHPFVVTMGAILDRHNKIRDVIQDRSTGYQIAQNRRSAVVTWACLFSRPVTRDVINRVSENN